jgi:ribosomal-protein-alanine N-acetyltransferase
MLRTERLDLLPLSSAQLKLYLENPDALERELGIPLSRSNVTERVRGAVRMKLAKMDAEAPARHPWLTYWLMIVRAAPFGAGLAGFKGFPDAAGEAEIGYGIDPLYQNQGYMTEAVRRLIVWAFEEPACSAVTAKSVLKSNAASRRVAEKSGMSVYEETDIDLSYRLERKKY